MAKPGELEAALRKADAAGDVEGARRLARAIRQERQMAAPAIEAKPAEQAPGQPQVTFTTGLDTELDTNRGMPDIVGQSRDYMERGGRSGELFRRGVEKLSDPGQQGTTDWSGLFDLAGSGVRSAYDFYADPEKTPDDKIAGTMQNVGEFSGLNAQMRDMQHSGVVPELDPELAERLGVNVPEGYQPGPDRAAWLLSAAFSGARGQIGSGKFRGRSPGMPKTPVRDAALDAVSNLTGGASDLGILATKPIVEGAKAGIGAARRALPPTSPVPSGPPVSAAPQAAPPPAVISPAASGAGGPPPGVLRQVSPPTPPGGQATRSFNAMDPKTREAALRLLENSGVQRGDIQAIIRDLDSLPPERRSQYGPEIVRRYGAQYPELEANIAAVGREFAVSTPKPKQFMGVTLERDKARQIMNDEVRRQIDSEGAFVTGTAEREFGPGVVPANKALEDELDVLSSKYESILSTKRKPTGRLRSQAKKDAVFAAREDLANYLTEPALARTMPDWVKKQVMLQASEDMRRLKFTPEELQLVLEGDGKVLAPLFESNAPLEWSPQLWQHLARQYPTQAAHSLQSAYRQAADTAFARGDPQSIADARLLTRLRGGEGGQGVLDRLEQAVPNYRETRLEFGDRKSAQRAIELLEDFKTAVRKEGDTAEIIRDIGELPARHRAMAENQITSLVRQAIKDKIESPKLGELGRGGLATPNLTQLSKQPFLEALPKVFGPKGQELADAIRWARSNTDYLTSIHPKYNSRSITNLEDVKNARNLYEDPAGADVTIFDRTAQLATAAGVPAAFIPGGQGVAVGMLTLAGAKSLYNAYKAGKRLSPKQRSQLADFLFRSRTAAGPEDLERIPGSRGPSPIGYAGNVAIGAGVGAGTAEATGQDPITGAAIGAGAGGARAAGRAFRAGRSVIPTGSAPRQLPTPSRPPGKPEKMGMGGAKNAAINWGVPAASAGTAFAAQPEGTPIEERLAAAGLSAVATRGIMPAVRRAAQASKPVAVANAGGRWTAKQDGKWWVVRDGQGDEIGKTSTQFDRTPDEAIQAVQLRRKLGPLSGGSEQASLGGPSGGPPKPPTGGTRQPFEFTPGFKSAARGPTEIEYAVQPDGYLEVMTVRTKPEARGQGNASTAFDEFLAAADEKGLTVHLTAEPITGAGGMSKSQLETFYKSRGFKTNSGRDKDFTVRSSLIREPKQPTPPTGRGGDDPFGDKAWAAKKKVGIAREGQAAAGRPLDAPPPEKPSSGVRNMQDMRNRQAARDQLEDLKVWREENRDKITNPQELVDLDNEIEALENFSRTGNAEGIVDELSGADRAAAQGQLRKLEAERRATRNPQFQADIDAEIDELRGALGMSPAVRPPIATSSPAPAPPPKPGQGGKGPPQARMGGPPKPQPKKLSAEEKELRNALNKARRLHDGARRRNVMRDNRDDLNRPFSEAEEAAADRLKDYLDRQAANRARVGRAKDVGQAILRNPVTHGLAGGGALGVGIIGVNMLTPDGPPKEKPMSPGDPRYYWSTVTKDKTKMLRVQQALDEWGDWDDEVEMNGNFGRTTKDAIRAWRSRRGLSLDGPMTRADVARLLAGPRGYQDKDNGAWRYGDGAASPPL